jgi:hypothetical protein
MRFFKYYFRFNTCGGSFRGKAGYLPRPYQPLRSKCIVGCIFRRAHYDS